MRRDRYEKWEVETLQDVCDVVYANTEYLLKQNRKLNKKVNWLTIILGAITITSISNLSKEVEQLKIKCSHIDY